MIHPFSHPFFQKSKKEQDRFKWKVVLLTISFAMLLLLVVGTLAFFVHSLFGLLMFLLPMGITLASQFIDVPAMVKAGKLRYFSTMFLAEFLANGHLVLHGGTLFDYYFVLKELKAGKPRTDFVMREYLKGLLRFLEYLESMPKETTIKGTSYFLNPRTAQRFGFQVNHKTDLLQVLILSFNFFQLTVAQSFLKGKLTFPKIQRAISIEAKKTDLINRRNYLKFLLSRMEEMN